MAQLVTRNSEPGTSLSTQHRSTDAERHAVMSLLERAALRGDGPLTAIELAEMCREIRGNRENRRRVIRAAIKDLREIVGVQICACNPEGYWVARDPREWEAYLESRRTGARFEFVSARRADEAAYAASGRQGRLF